MNSSGASTLAASSEPPAARPDGKHQSLRKIYGFFFLHPKRERLKVGLGGRGSSHERSTPPSSHPTPPSPDTTHRHVTDAYTISVVRTRTVTALEFFWNIYSVFKSIITTFLGLPGVSMALSTLGADQIMNIPGVGGPLPVQA